MLTQNPGGGMITDPLAVQFMTGGQMGYMPQAQYLTPAEYGTFRTMPTGPQNNFLQQDPGFLQSLLIRSYGGPLGLPKYTFNTYNPAVNQQLYMNNMQQRGWDQIAAGAAAVGGFAADSIIQGGLGFALGGLPGFAASMLLPSLGVSDSITDRIRDLRSIQNMTMSRIVGGPDVNPVTGMGFNASASRRLDSFLRMSAADDAVLKEGDWRKLMQLGVEYGQFDFASNSYQYKDIMKKLRGTLTTMMEVIGSSDFKDVMNEFKRMQTMGADITEYRRIARQENMYARMTGLTHEDMVNTYGQSGAVIFQQNGLAGYQGSLASMSNAATVALGQRMGLIDPATLSRYGGASGMAQTMTQLDALSLNRMRDMILPYFMNNNATGLDPNANLMDLLNSDNPLQMMADRGMRKMSNMRTGMNYLRNRDRLYNELMRKEDAETMEFVFADSIGKSYGLRGRESVEFGLTILNNGNMELASQKANKLYDDTARENAERERILERRKRREEEDLANNPFRKLARSLDKALTRFGEGLFGSVVDSYTGWVEQNNRRDAGYVSGNTSWNSYVQDAANVSRGGNRNVSLPNNEFLGSLAAKYETGNDILHIGYDKSGGTSYGRFQFASAQGNIEQFKKYIASKASTDAEAKDILDLMNSYTGSWDTGSREGAPVDLWKKIASGEHRGKLMELEEGFLKQEYYDSTLSKLRPEVRAMIEGSSTLQQMYISTTNQHGGTLKGGIGILNNAYKPGMTKEDLARAVYAERYRRRPLPRFTEDQELGDILNMLRIEDQGTASGEFSGLRKFINDSVRESTNTAIKNKVGYKRGGNSSKGPNAKIDCSGWVAEILDTIFETAVDSDNKKIFGDAAKQALRGKDGKERPTSGSIIKNLGDLAKEVYNTEDLRPNSGKVRAGMIIGIDTDYQSGHYEDIDHIAYTFEKNGELWVSESAGGVGVREVKYSDWYNNMLKKKRGGTRFFGVDTMRLSEAELKKNKGVTGVRRPGELKPVYTGMAPESKETPEERLRKDAMAREAWDQYSGAWLTKIPLTNVNFQGEEIPGNAQNASYFDAIFANRLISTYNYEKNRDNTFENLRYSAGKLAGSGLGDDFGSNLRVVLNARKVSDSDFINKETTTKFAREVLNEALKKGGMNTEKEREETINKLLSSDAFLYDVAAAALKEGENSDDAYNQLSIRYKNNITSNVGRGLNLRSKKDKELLEKFKKAYAPNIGDADYNVRKNFEAALDQNMWVGNVARLIQLKNLKDTTNADEMYRSDFIAEAKKFGFSEKEAEDLYRKQDAITIYDLAKSTKGKSLTKEQFEAGSKAGMAVAAEMRKGAKTYKQYDEEYKRIIGENGFVPEEALVHSDIQNRMGIYYYQQKYSDILKKPEDILDPVKLKEVLEAAKKGGDPTEQEQLAAAAKKAASGEKLTSLDFNIIPKGKTISDDILTFEARQQYMQDAEQRRLRKEEDDVKKERGSSLLDVQFYGDPNAQANGGVTNKTLSELAKALEKLVNYLNGGGSAKERGQARSTGQGIK